VNLCPTSEHELVKWDINFQDRDETAIF